MDRNINKNAILYSVCTKLAYKINKRYYHNIHYVWCTSSFNSAKQPPTSNPCTIIRRYLEQISSGDRHAFEIDQNKAGILKGAKIKFDTGKINKSQYEEIKKIVSTADYQAFFPVLYIIHTKKARSRCLAVPLGIRASDESLEYRIEDLEDGEFQVIDFESVLSELIPIADKRAGE